MQCDICKQYFDRGTSVLPDNYCDECLEKFVTIKKVDVPIDEMVQHYNLVIKVCTKEIEKCLKTIQESVNTIDFAQNQLRILK